jgi:hypothetical protein
MRKSISTLKEDEYRLRIGMMKTQARGVKTKAM